MNMKIGWWGWSSNGGKSRSKMNAREDKCNFVTRKGIGDLIAHKSKKEKSLIIPLAGAFVDVVGRIRIKFLLWSMIPVCRSWGVIFACLWLLLKFTFTVEFQEFVYGCSLWVVCSLLLWFSLCTLGSIVYGYMGFFFPLIIRFSSEGFDCKGLSFGRMIPSYDSWNCSFCYLVVRTLRVL